MHNLCEIPEYAHYLSTDYTALSSEDVNNVTMDKRIYKHFLTLLLGVGIFIFGLSSFVVINLSPRQMSDQEIINKAKALGLVEMKDLLKAEEDKQEK